MNIWIQEEVEASVIDGAAAASSCSPAGNPPSNDDASLSHVELWMNKEFQLP